MRGLGSRSYGRSATWYLARMVKPSSSGGSIEDVSRTTDRKLLKMLKFYVLFAQARLNVNFNIQLRTHDQRYYPGPGLSL